MTTIKYPYHIYKEHIIIQDSLLPSIETTQSYSTEALHTGNSLETNLAQIKNGLGINMN